MKRNFVVHPSNGIIAYTYTNSAGYYNIKASTAGAHCVQSDTRCIYISVSNVDSKYNYVNNYAGESKFDFIPGQTNTFNLPIDKW